MPNTYTETQIRETMRLCYELYVGLAVREEAMLTVLGRLERTTPEAVYQAFYRKAQEQVRSGNAVFQDADPADVSLFITGVFDGLAAGEEEGTFDKACLVSFQTLNQEYPGLWATPLV